MIKEAAKFCRFLENIKAQSIRIVIMSSSARVPHTPPHPSLVCPQHHTQYTKRLRKLAAKYLPNWKLDLFSFHRQFVFHMQIFRWVENVSCNRVGECRWAHDNYLFTMLWSYDIAVAFNHPYFSFMFWIGERDWRKKVVCRILAAFFPVSLINLCEAPCMILWLLLKRAPGPSP